MHSLPLHFLHGLLLCVCGCVFSGEQPALFAKAEQLARGGDLSGAMDLLKTHLKSNAKDAYAYNFLARVQFYNGDEAEGMATLREGLNQTDDTDLLELQAHVYERQGRDGPNVSYKRDSVTYAPSKDPEKDEAFKKERNELALETYRQLAARRKEDSQPAIKIAELLGTLKRFEDALKVWEQGAKSFPQEEQFLLGLAGTFVKLKRADEAAPHFQAALLLNPRLAHAHAALAEYHHRRNEPELARQSRERAAFYEWLPPGTTLKYSDAHFTTFRKLVTDRERELSKEEWKAFVETRKAELDRLMKDPSADAAEFLGALCYKHDDCGAVEDAMFAELGRRGASTAALLHNLLGSCQSTCTARGAALALATQKDERIFDWLVRTLPRDTRHIFHMNLANALDVLGDPRAVNVLIEVMQPDSPLKEARNDDENPMNEREGREDARCRAALALGAFDTPTARTALEAGLKDPHFRIYCQAALLRQKPDSPHRGEIAAQFKAPTRKNRYVLYQLKDYFRRTLPEFAASLPEIKEEERQSGVRVEVKPAD